MVDRFDFPEGILRVTGGPGGEALLITGSEKTALLDCGMAYCADVLIENIKRELKGRALDFVLLSHTHYDHIGALPFIKQVWPDSVACGAAYAEKVFNKQGAINTINALSKKAAELFGNGRELIVPDNGYAVDRIVVDKDEISLGEEKVVVLETKGHTDCSLTFALEPSGIMFFSESTGIYVGSGKTHNGILKSYKDAIESVEKCKRYGAKRLISHHFGILPADFTDKYWELYLADTENYKSLLYGLFDLGLTDAEALEKCVKRLWSGNTSGEQPIEAFRLNTANTIKVFRQEYERDAPENS